MNYFVWKKDELPPLAAIVKAARKIPGCRIYEPISRIEPYFEIILAATAFEASQVYASHMDHLEFVSDTEFVLWNDDETDGDDDEPIIYYFEDYALLH